MRATGPLCKFSEWTLVTALVLSGTTGTCNSQGLKRGQHPLDHLIESSPALSPMRFWLKENQPGDGVDKAYMKLMTTCGIKRALYEVHGQWKQERVDSPQISWRLYFSNYDGPSGTLIDQRQLERVDKCGARKVLDELALSRMKNAQLVCVDCDSRVTDGTAVYGHAEMYDNPWIREARTSLSLESNRAPSLFQAVTLGNILNLNRSLNERTWSNDEIQFAFILAVGDPMHDNTSVMGRLLKFGANVNRSEKKGLTPLMIAIRNPAHVDFLLREGADSRAKDADGFTALDHAKKAAASLSVTLIERAARY